MCLITMTSFHVILCSDTLVSDSPTATTIYWFKKKKTAQKLYDPLTHSHILITQQK